MKYLSLAVLALALTLGACARHDNAPMTTTNTSATTTGYSK